MALRTTVTLYEEDGDESDRIVDDYVSTAYTAFGSYRKTLTASGDRITIGLGAVTTIQHLLISTDTAIVVYLDTDVITVTVGTFLLITGCSHALLEVIAATGAELFVYAAGV